MGLVVFFERLRSLALINPNDLTIGFSFKKLAISLDFTGYKNLKETVTIQKLDDDCLFSRKDLSVHKSVENNLH